MSLNSRKILVLNLDMRPLTAIHWQKGLMMAMEGSVIVLELAKDKDGNVIIIHSAGGEEFELPSVVMCPSYVRSEKSAIRYSKYAVFYRDGYSCQYCGCDNGPMTIDHVRPRSVISSSGEEEGDLWKNRVTCCQECNTQKGNRSLDDMKGERTWNGRPFKLTCAPKRPDSSGISRFLRQVTKNNIEWLDYLPGWEIVAERFGKHWMLIEKGKEVPDDEPRKRSVGGKKRKARKKR